MGVPVLALGLLAAVPTLAYDCSECGISRALSEVPGATVNYIKHIPLGGNFTGSAKDTFLPANYSGLPALCAVSVNVPSSANTSFNFGLILPDTWNGRFIATGNGGFGGGINWVCFLVSSLLSTSNTISRAT
jgi:feruloyl esterase